MNIRRIAQEEPSSDMVRVIIAADATGKRVVYLKDRQALGTQCTALIDKLAPGQGVIGHNHVDYTGDGPDRRKVEREKQVNV